MGCGWTSTSHVGFVGTVGFEEGIASHRGHTDSMDIEVYCIICFRSVVSGRNGGGCGGLGETAAGKDMGAEWVT